MKEKREEKGKKGKGKKQPLLLAHTPKVESCQGRTQDLLSGDSYWIKIFWYQLRKKITYITEITQTIKYTSHLN